MRNTVIINAPGHFACPGRARHMEHTEGIRVYKITNRFLLLFICNDDSNNSA